MVLFGRSKLVFSFGKEHKRIELEPPNNPAGMIFPFSLSITSAKSIDVSESCGYLDGTLTFPLSMQNICSLHKQKVKAKIF